MNPHDDDDERLPGEDELAALYSKLPDRQPGPALDAAVLRAAAEAIRPAVAQRRRPRWPVALGTAATLVIAMGLGWHMREWPSATRPAASPALSAERDAFAPATATTVTTVNALQPAALPPPPPPAPALQADAAPRRAVPYEPEARGELRPAPRIALAKRERSIELPPAAAPVPGNEAVNANAAAPAADVAASQAGADKAMADAAGASTRQALARSASKPIGALVPAAPAAFANSSAPAATRAQSDRAEPLSGGMPQPMQESAMAPAPAPPPPVGMAAKTSQADATAAEPGDTPAQELEKIRRLFALGRRDEARQRLAAFRQAHPDYALPPELRAQLPTP